MTNSLMTFDQPRLRLKEKALLIYSSLYKMASLYSSKQS